MNLARLLRAVTAGAFLLATGDATAAVVIRKPDALVPLVDALVETLRRTPVDGATRIVDLSGDSAADAARVSRQCAGASVVFAVGPEAAASVSTLGSRIAVIVLGVPNPARIATAATFVPVYPRLQSVLAFASTKLRAKRVGLLHSPAQNREAVTVFTQAAAAAGVTIVPLAAGSGGELVRVLGGLAAVDAVILAIDPLVFDRQSLRLIVEKTGAAKKPTVGFLPELASLGVTVVLSIDPKDVAAAAVQASTHSAKPGTHATVEVEGSTVLVSRRSAEIVGLSPEALGAHQIR